MTAQGDAPSAGAPRKKQRTELRNTASRIQASALSQERRLFVPFRALGLVTNHVPFHLQARSHKGATDGPKIHILTCLGRSWALWEGGKMSLLFVGPEASEPLSCVFMDGDAVWATSGSQAIKYVRGKEVFRLSNPLGTPLGSITIFGSQCLALTEDGSRMIIWSIGPDSFAFTAALHFDNGFTATLMLHPATYLNKILVASREGEMQLWNVRTQTCIHKFTSSSLLTSSTATPSIPMNSITSLVQSPAIDVVGVGFSSGEISVYDVRTDERLMRLYMEGGRVTSLSFRDDGHPVLCSASSSGSIALWDLNSGGRLMHIIRGAHESAVSAIAWVPGQPVLISSGEDNSVKQWLFDSPTAAPRLLKYRSGHQSPPHLVRYYGEDGKQLLTASSDRSLRYTSVVRDSRSFELSQGSLAKKSATLSKSMQSLKFPSITAMSYSTTRAKDWDDILTAHVDESLARTWSVQNKKVGRHIFQQHDGSKQKSTSSGVKAVCITACGNFGLTGMSNGSVCMWNMQSGIQRRVFEPASPASESGRGNGDKREDICVSGIATDALNRVVIVSTSGGTLNFFNFHTSNVEHTLHLSSSISSVLLHRDTGLLAAACEDMRIRIIDIETHRVVRELSCGSRGRILDMSFSPDCRWIIASSFDSVIRTFDIPTGQLVDAFRTPSIAPSITFSPTNDFLATAHANSPGVYLWVNRAQYTEVPLRSIREEDVVDVDMPAMQGAGEGDEDITLESLVALTIAEEATNVFSTPPQLDGDLVTLTLLPRSRWQTLLNLDVIQLRNKPKEPPKKPEQAPFFLPTLPGVEGRFAAEKKDVEKKEHVRRLDRAAATRSESVFQRRLVGLVSENDDTDIFFDYVKTLSPAAIDVELRSLVTISSLCQFLQAVRKRLGTRRDFEAVQTLLNVFLRMHAEVLLENEETQEEMEMIVVVQRRESERILELTASSVGTLGFVRDVM